MIKLKECHVCDLCETDLRGHRGGRECFVCKREVCLNCSEDNYSFVFENILLPVQGWTCRQCKQTLYTEKRVKEALDKFLLQWKLLSTREHDLSTLS